MPKGSTTPETPVLRVMGVVARPEKSHYLRHLAPADGREAWETRFVHTLCGQRFAAAGYVERAERTGQSDRFGYVILRRSCPRCDRAATAQQAREEG